ncbi:MAG TPA: sulfatase-like hydrolase/transferase, partial [Thermoanaerobaculia bacterium]|nr:sulfatase-like hydrolase/transferase [Thermoanaerobaculia bacterium]
CISYIDAQLGRVLDALEEEGLAERTVIVLTSDHGYHLGEKGKWSKDSSLYEPVLRVPLLISAPGAYAHGAASPRTVELVDLYPTLMELLGLAPPEGLEGRSLVPLLLDPLAQHNRPAVSVAAWEGTIVGRSIRTERYRLTEWFGGKRGTEFYDYESDPQEVDNQARNPEYRAQRKRLKALLRARAPVPEWDSEPPADESADGPEKN